MEKRKKVSVIFGTRPEAIKLAPLILELRRHESFDCHVCVTAQHRQMLDQVCEIFDIAPDVDLNLMKSNQTLPDITARALTGLSSYIEEEKPDMVLVQGDTTTVFSCALAAFYQHVAIGHVEAGLRTGNMQSPWPEEANRTLTSQLAQLHFAPTKTSRKNLLNEHVPEESIIVTGNTVIDTLFLALRKIAEHSPHIHELPDNLQPVSSVKGQNLNPRMVLITGHRRENFGSGFENICKAVAQLAAYHPDVHFVYPVHLNPNVQEPVKRILTGNASFSNVHLIEPLDYLPFVGLMARSHIILTDSGGVQEEAPSLGKPVLVMRDTTERPEAVEAGTVRLVGADQHAIIAGVSELLTDKSLHSRMSQAHNPYGDGRAVGRHINALMEYWKLNHE